MTVYFLRAGESGAIKIGYTAGDPLRRMADLQVGCPHRLEMIACIEGVRSAEKKIQWALAAHKTVGEWFRPHSAVIAAVDAAIANGVPVHTPKRAKPANDACEIIEVLGGNAAVANLTRSKPSAISNWKKRGQFPGNTFVILRAALERHNRKAPVELWGMVRAEQSA